MDPQSLAGGFEAPPLDAAAVFRAVLSAMSRPGTIWPVGGANPPKPMGVAAGAVALTLCDHDTPVWLAPSVDLPSVRDWLSFHTGAPLAARAEAHFAFGPWAELAPFQDFRVGTPEYPDRSATFVIAMEDLAGPHRLTGPGIEDVAHLMVPDVAAFQENRARFPLGWDAILTSGNRLAAVPRTTIVEAPRCT